MQIWHGVQEKIQWLPLPTHRRRKVGNGESLQRCKHMGDLSKGVVQVRRELQKERQGMPFPAPPTKAHGVCASLAHNAKKQTCLYKHPRINYKGWDPHLSGRQLGQSHNWCGPNNGGNNRLAQSQHQWSTVGKASSEPAPCRAGFHPDTHCRREHLPHNFDAQNVWAQHPGRTGRAETGAETVPIWNNIKQPGLNRLWYDEYPSTWKDDNYWTPLQNKSQRRNSAPGSSNQSHCAQRGGYHHFPFLSFESVPRASA